MNQLGGYFLNNNDSQWNNGCFFRYAYSSKNHVMCSPFVPSIIIFGRSLFYYSIMNILLTVIVYGRMWLIIRGIVFSTRLPIMIWCFSPKLFVLEITIFFPMGDTWLLISDLLPIILTKSSSKDDCLTCSSIFLEGFDEIFHAFLLLLLLLDIIRNNCFDKLQRKKKQNYYTVMENLEVKLESFCESKFISWNIELIPCHVRSKVIQYQYINTSILIVDKYTLKNMNIWKSLSGPGTLQ